MPEVEDKIKVINSRLKEIDEQIDKLGRLKRKLLAERDKLTDNKNFAKSEALAKNEWQRGNLTINFSNV